MTAKIRRYSKLRQGTELLASLCGGPLSRGKVLSGVGVCVFFTLSQMGRPGEFCRLPSCSLVAELLGTNRSAVHRAIHRLAAQGMLTFKHSGRDRLFQVIGPNVRAVSGSLLRRVVRSVIPEGDLPARPVVGLPPEVLVMEDEPSGADVVLGTPTGSHPDVLQIPSEQARWFLDSPDNMHLFLRFGLPAYGHTLAECHGMTSTSTDWLGFGQHSTKYPFDQEWKIGHYMGYHWDGVCRLRARHGVPLTFPRWGRLADGMGPLLAEHTPIQAYSRIWELQNGTSLIEYMLRQAGRQLVMDECTLTDRHVLAAVERIFQHGQLWKDEAQACMSRGEPLPLAEMDAELDAMTGGPP